MVRPLPLSRETKNEGGQPKPLKEVSEVPGQSLLGKLSDHGSASRPVYYRTLFPIETPLPLVDFVEHRVHMVRFPIEVLLKGRVVVVNLVKELGNLSVNDVITLL